MSINDNGEYEPALMDFDTMNKVLIKLGYSKKDASDTATQILNYFGYSDRLLDNMLSNKERDMFYQWEDDGIVTWGKEFELYVPRGYDPMPLRPKKSQRNWRVYMWKLRINDMKRMLGKKEITEDTEEKTYDDLPREAWERT